MIATADWDTFWEIRLSHPVHPPGYYLLLRFSVAQLGHNEFALRLPSAWIGVLAIPLMYVIGRRFGSKTALVASLLIAINPFWAWYSQEARMYTLSMCLAIVVAYLFLRLLDRPYSYRWIAFVAASSLAYSVHYFTLFLPLVQFIYLVTHLRKRTYFFRVWAIAQGIAAIPLILWVYAASRQEFVRWALAGFPNRIG